MNKEHDILKWFEGDISTEEIKSRYPNEDFSTLEKLGFYAKHIEVPKVQPEEALRTFKTRSFKKSKAKVISLNFSRILKVAAILVMMLTSSYFLFFNATKSFTTEIAQTQTLHLPDNSEVVLNAQSKLTYNKKNWPNHRTLNLDGEAFFKVTKGNKFTVKTKVGTVQVLGTQFNVKERPNYFEVQCYRGSVRVQFGDEKTVLVPGKAFRVVNGEIDKTKDFNAQKPSWLQQESAFDNVPLWQVIDELEIQYDITINSDHVDTSKKFTGSFTHNDMGLALQSVTIPLRLSYKINGKKVEFYHYEAK